MSDDKYYQRLESLFSGTEHVPPDPDQPARPPEAPDAEALQARLAELEAAADEARRQAEQERTQRAAAAAEAENLRARMAELEAASAQPQPTTTDNLAGQVDAGVAEEVTSQTEMPAASSEARP